MTKPRIVYTTRNFSLDPLQWLTALSIRVAGGVPVRVSPRRPHYDQNIDGLIIGGGTDLYPALHKLTPKPNYKYDPPRDELEMTWLKRAEDEGLPVLGICRGAQLLNVMRGGSLHVDVAKAYENAKYPANMIARIFFRKDMNITGGSLLSDIFKTNRIAVNSMHSQAIDKVGQNLVVSANEDNGVVQAVEDSNKPFFMGVQFHPEALIYKRVFRGLFKRLIETARGA